MLAAPTELNQAAFSEPTHRNTTAQRSIHHRAGAGAKAQVVRQIGDFLHSGGDVQRLTGQRGIQHLSGQFKGRPGDGFLVVLDDDAQQVALRGGHHFDEAQVQVRAGLQVKGQIVKDCGESGGLWLVKRLKLECRQPSEQARLPIRGRGVQRQEAHPAFERGDTGPTIWSPQCKDLLDADKMPLIGG